jgi:hypothetical protein
MGDEILNDNDQLETQAYSNHSANTIEEWLDDKKDDDVWK